MYNPTSLREARVLQFQCWGWSCVPNRSMHMEQTRGMWASAAAACGWAKPLPSLLEKNWAPGGRVDVHIDMGSWGGVWRCSFHFAAALPDSHRWSDTQWPLGMVLHNSVPAPRLSKPHAALSTSPCLASPAFCSGMERRIGGRRAKAMELRKEQFTGNSNGFTWGEKTPIIDNSGQLPPPFYEPEGTPPWKGISFIHSW